MRRKKSYKTRKKSAIKLNKEIIKKSKEDMNILRFCGDVNIKMTCIECKEVLFIRTHYPEAFTEEVKKNYRCLVCGSKREI